MTLVSCDAKNSNELVRAEKTQLEQSSPFGKPNQELIAITSPLPTAITARILGQATSFMSLVSQVLSQHELIVLVDKQHGLPADYQPNDLVNLANFSAQFSVSRKDHSLRRSAAKALAEMNKAALKADITLLISSTFRSFSYQSTVFSRNVREQGQKEAERVSARPGTSQHQLGTAIDFGSITQDFAYTKAGKWLFEQAGKHGWSLSYPEGAEDLTGYMWEPWHYRYLGIAACQLQKDFFEDSQQTMLTFLHYNREQLIKLSAQQKTPTTLQQAIN